MLYDVEIKGVRPIIMHSGAGVDTSHPANIEKAEISSKKGRNRTKSDDARIAELECEVSLWLDEDGAPTIPASALRSAIEKGAKKRKQGGQVREGLIVHDVLEFTYDRGRYGDNLDDLIKKTAFSVPVVLRGSRIIRTRAKFELPWGCKFVLECYDDQVDERMLWDWLDIAGRRLGLGNWRPEKSGDYGRFEVVEISPRES